MSANLNSEYKFVSASATAVDTLLKPMSQRFHTSMLTGTDSIKSKTSSCIDSVNSSTGGFLCFILKPIQAVNYLSNFIARSSVIDSYKDQTHTLDIISRGFDKRQQEYEKYFSLYGKSTNNDWVFSLENRKVIKRVLEYMGNNLGEVKDYPLYSSLRYLKAYGKLQKYERKARPVKVIQLNDFLRDGLLKLATYSRFAAGVYGGLLPESVPAEEREAILEKTTKRDRFKLFTGLSDEEVLVYDDVANNFLPGYSIVVSHKLCSIILAIRGTVDPFDILADLDADEIKRSITDPKSGKVIAEGLVHKGMIRCAENINTEVKPKILELLKQYKNYSLHICGHSLGGGTTALLALIWLSDKQIIKRGFTASALAPPPTVDKTLNEHLKKVLFSASCGDDIVPRISEGSIKDLAEVVRYFYQSENVENLAGIKTKTIVQDSNEDKLFRQEYLNIVSRFKNPKLETPGNVVTMLNKGVHASYDVLGQQGEVAWSYLENSCFEEIILSKTFVSDHGTIGYVRNLEIISSSL